MNPAPIPGVVETVVGDVLQSGARLVAPHNALYDEGISLRAVVVSVDFVDRKSEESVFAGEPVVGLESAELGGEHLWKWPAALVGGIDDVAAVDNATGIADRAAARVFRDGFAGKAVQRFHEFPADGGRGGVHFFRVIFLRQIMGIGDKEKSHGIATSGGGHFGEKGINQQWRGAGGRE